MSERALMGFSEALLIVRWECRPVRFSSTSWCLFARASFASFQTGLYGLIGMSAGSSGAIAGGITGTVMVGAAKSGHGNVSCLGTFRGEPPCE